MSTDDHAFSEREQRLERVLADYLRSAEQGQPLDRGRLLAEHPDLTDELRAFFRNQDEMNGLAERLRAKTPPDAQTLALGDDGSMPGTRVRYFGNYELLEEIARGGMGVVYKARQFSLNRTVALKMILAGQLASEDDVRRFRAEAEAAAQLQHPNIVAIHEVGEHEGQHYFSMDYVEGPSLSALIREHPLPAMQAAEIVKTVAQAIHYAHQKGILHRDLKPANVLLESRESRVESPGPEGTNPTKSGTGGSTSQFATSGSRLSTLDPRPMPKITDFGLAKRIAGESELTGTGQVLGTPSYMPPEQAAGRHGEVGPHSDVYSLGAILYELLTGRPPFRAETPLETLMQVLNSDPVSPRLLNASVPRDLETICMKCLAKEPSQRYPTAGELAADLERFLAGDSIRARRPSVAEQMARWTRKQRRSVIVGITGAALAVLLLTASVSAWFGYQQWRLGHLSLDTNGPVLVAEVLDARGRNVVPRFTIPTQEPVAVPAGSYRVRIAGTRMLSQTYELLVERATKHEFTIRTEDHPAWPPIDVPRTFEVVRLDGRADVILLTEDGLKRFQAATRETVWEVNLNATEQPALAQCPGFVWNWFTSQSPSGRGLFDRSPRLVRSAVHDPITAEVPDLDADGVGDLVWAMRHQPALLAVSGRTGALLWCFLGSHGADDPKTASSRHSEGAPGDVTAELTTGASAEAHHSPADGTVIGLPSLADADGDGTADLIVTFAATNAASDEAKAGRGLQQWIEAVSGRDGRSLWRVDLDGRWFDLPPRTEIPYAARWLSDFVPAAYTGGGHGSSTEGQWSLASQQPSHDSPLLSYAAHIIPGTGAPVALAVAGTQLIGLDARSGDRLFEPVSLGFVPVRDGVVRDVDGDGHPEVLLMQKTGDKAVDLLAMSFRPVPAVAASGTTQGNVSVGRIANPPYLAAGAGSGKTPRWDVKRLWKESLSAWVEQHSWFDAPPNWPLVEDLDGDGRREVIVPGTDPSPGYGGTDWCSLQVLDGGTGQLRWQHRMRHLRLQPDRFTVGNDVDGDGQREVFVASLVSGGGKVNGLSLFVDALSGKDGRCLWWTQQPLRDHWEVSNGLGIGPLTWWIAGPDGWPQLVVPYNPGPVRGSPATYIFSACTGQLVHAISGVTEPYMADLNGDSTRELFAFRPDRAESFDGGGQLLLFGSALPPAGEWHRLGGIWSPAQDLDGDGCDDLVRTTGSTATVSGRTGELLWRLRTPARDFLSPPLPLGDFDGDGGPDVVGLLVPRGGGSFMDWGLRPLFALSGKTGRRLWTADIRADNFAGVQLADCRDLDHDGRAEVLFAAGMDPNGNGTNQIWQWWLSVVSSRDGHLIWRQALSPHANWGGSSIPEVLANPGYEDLNGDGVLDLVMPAINSQMGAELRAFSGRDGRLLWQRSMPPADRYALLNQLPAYFLTDLEADGKPDVALIESHVVTRLATEPDLKIVATRSTPFENASGDREQLTGRWTVQVGSSILPARSDTPAQQGTDDMLAFYGDRITASLQEQTLEGTFVLESSSRAKSIRIQPSNPEELPLRGIYELQGTQLTISARREWPHTPTTVVDHYEIVLLDGTDGQKKWTVPMSRTDMQVDDDRPELRIADVTGDGQRDVCICVRDSGRAWNVLVLDAGGRVAARLGGDGQPLDSGTRSLLGLTAGHASNSVDLNDRASDVYVRVLESSAQRTICRLIQPALAKPAALSSLPTGRASASETATAPARQSDRRRAVFRSVTPQPDPRRTRRLPWAHMAAAIPEVILAAVLSIILVLIPGLGIRGAIIRRYWSLLWLMGWLTVCAAIFAALRLVTKESETIADYVGRLGGPLMLLGYPVASDALQSVTGLVRLAIQGLPVVLFPGIVLVAAMNQQWKRVVRWLALFVVATAGIALLAVSADSSHAGPGFHYSWEGWYWVFFAGAYFTGFLTFVIMLIRTTVRALRKRKPAARISQPT